MGEEDLYVRIGNALLATLVVIHGAFQNYRLKQIERSNQSTPRGRHSEAEARPTDHSGETLRDLIEALADNQDAMTKRQESIEGVLDEIKASLRTAFVDNAFVRTAAKFIGDRSRMCLFFTNREGSNTMVSRNYLDVTGHQERDLLGRGWESIVHLDDHDAFVRQVEFALSTESRIVNYRMRIKYSSGRFYWISITIEPVFEHGNFVGMVGGWFPFDDEPIPIEEGDGVSPVT